MYDTVFSSFKRVVVFLIGTDYKYLYLNVKSFINVFLELAYREDLRSVRVLR